MIIAVTGTPGTGKTYVSHTLSKLMRLQYVNLNRFAIKECLLTYDTKRKTKVIDVKKLSKRGRFKDSVLDSHLSHFCKNDFTIILRTRPDVLKRRLKNRGWSESKIKENVEAEILGVISSETRGFEFDTTGKHPKQTAKSLLRAMKTRRKNKPIDWMRRYGKMLR